MLIYLGLYSVVSRNHVARVVRWDLNASSYSPRKSGGQLASEFLNQLRGYLCSDVLLENPSISNHLRIFLMLAKQSCIPNSSATTDSAITQEFSIVSFRRLSVPEADSPSGDGAAWDRPLGARCHPVAYPSAWGGLSADGHSTAASKHLDWAVVACYRYLISRFSD